MGRPYLSTGIEWNPIAMVVPKAKRTIHSMLTDPEVVYLDFENTW